MLCGLADAVDSLVAQGVSPRRVLLVGGAAASPAVRSVASALFGLPIHVPTPGEYVAEGAARQAAWALAGTADPPTWSGAPSEVVTTDPTPQVRAAYAEARAAAYPTA